MKYIQRICSFFMLVVLAGSICMPGNVEAATTKKTVRVAMLEYPNFMNYDSDGNPTGFACDYLDKIAEYTGWEYEYVPMSFAESQSALAAGEVDIVPGSQYTKERAALYDYGKNSMTTDSNVLCVKADNTDFYYNDYAALEDRKIGYLSGTIRAQQLQNVLDEHQVAVEMCEFSNNADEVAALNAGQVDAILMASMRCTSDYRIIVSFNPSDVYFTCNPNDASIKQGIDDAQDEILSVDPYFNMELYEKHYGDIPKAYAFSVEEREYL